MLGASLDMAFEMLLSCEDPGALQHDIDAHGAPGQPFKVLLIKHGAGLPVDDHATVNKSDVAVVTAIHGIVCQQIEEILRRSEIVDRDQIETANLEAALERGPADSAEAVDGQPGHTGLLTEPLRGRLRLVPRRAPTYRGAIFGWHARPRKNAPQGSRVPRA